MPKIQSNPRTGRISQVGGLLLGVEVDQGCGGGLMNSDAEIVRQVLEGDRESYAVLVARHEKAVWATAWQILRDGHAASDVAQDAFVHAFHHLQDLRQPELFGVWLLRITRREAVRAARASSAPGNADRRRERRLA